MRRAWLIPVLALALAGCSGGTPQAQVRGDVQDVIEAANGRNPDAVRGAVADLEATLSSLVAQGDYDKTKADQLRVLAARIAQNADRLKPAEPSAEPQPEPTSEPQPEPTSEPEPSPTPPPEPEPTQEPQPEPTTEPEPVVSIGVVEPPQESPTQTPVTQPVASPAARRSSIPSPQPTVR